MSKTLIAIATLILLFAGCRSSREILSMGAEYSNRFEPQSQGDVTARVEYRVEILR